MAGSRIVAVRSALIIGITEKLADTDGMKKVTVGFQWGRDWQKRDYVWTRRARISHTAAAMKSGRNFRNEVGTFDLVAFATGVNKSQEWTTQRAIDIGAVLEEFIADRKNNELNVPGLQTLQIAGDGDISEAPGDKSFLAEISYPVRYTARLT